MIRTFLPSARIIYAPGPHKKQFSSLTFPDLCAQRKEDGVGKGALMALAGLTRPSVAIAVAISVAIAVAIESIDITTFFKNSNSSNRKIANVIAASGPVYNEMIPNYKKTVLPVLPCCHRFNG